MKVNIGFQAIAMHGDISRMREAWMEAEAIGADRLYSSDHINALGLNTSVMEGDQQSVTRVEERLSSRRISVVTVKRERDRGK